MSVIALIAWGCCSIAKPPSQRFLYAQNYIEQYKHIAIEQMYLYKIPASITIAQGIVESEAGTSELALNANNHFGIKCKNDWCGESYTYTDDAPDECFRKYTDPVESFKDHSVFLATRKWYQNLFELSLYDYKAWAKGLKKAGYATLPKYADLLISVIERFDLHELDKMPLKLSQQGLKPIDSSQLNLVITKDIDYNYRYHTFRTINFTNGARFVQAKQGDTYFRLASEYNLTLKEIYAYNDLKSTNTLQTGDIIFIDPKIEEHKKGIHSVEKQQTLYEIAQEYGIKLETLERLNTHSKTEPIAPGNIVFLNKDAKRVYLLASKATASLN